MKHIKMQFYLSDTELNEHEYTFKSVHLLETILSDVVHFGEEKRISISV